MPPTTMPSSGSIITKRESSISMLRRRTRRRSIPNIRRATCTPRAGSASGTHLHGSNAFYRDVAEALAGAHAFLVTGPSTAKTEFVAYLSGHAPKVLALMSGEATLPRVTDHQLVAEACRHFKSADRMTPQVD